LTSSGGSGDAARCRALGVSAYLRKPINGAELLQAISSVVEQPRRRPQPAVAKGLDIAGAAAPEMRLRVLLAEDNVVNQRVAVGLLQKRGHQVTVVSNGREALERLERETFDVTLMDVQMPEMDGFEAVAAWRERERQRQDDVRLRIIALTAHAMSGDRERCLAAGMDGYLTKPLDPNMLFAAIERTGSTPAGGASPAPPIESAAILSHSLAAIKSAVDRRDAGDIQAAASVLKKAAANLSAGGLYEAAAILERVGAERRLDAAEAAWRRVAGEGSMLIDALRSQYTTGS
jgi:CheY-like chemotaxis protein